MGRPQSLFGRFWRGEKPLPGFETRNIQPLANRYTDYTIPASTISIIIKFFTPELWLGKIHISWDVEINRIRLGGLICSLKSFLQLNMRQELQISAVVYMYWGASCLVRRCDSDFGISPVDDITIGIACAAFCFHMANISFATYYYYYYYHHHHHQYFCCR